MYCSVQNVQHKGSLEPPFYLHGDCVFNQHRSQLSVELEEDLSLAGLVQVTQGQRLDVQRLSSLQLHLT